MTLLKKHLQENPDPLEENNDPEHIARRLQGSLQKHFDRLNTVRTSLPEAVQHYRTHGDEEVLVAEIQQFHESLTGTWNALDHWILGALTVSVEEFMSYCSVAKENEGKQDSGREEKEEEKDDTKNAAAEGKEEEKEDNKDSATEEKENEKDSLKEEKVETNNAAIERKEEEKEDNKDSATEEYEEEKDSVKEENEETKHAATERKEEKKRRQQRLCYTGKGRKGRQKRFSYTGKERQTRRQT